MKAREDARGAFGGILLGVVPVRCFSCGALIGDKWEEFKRRVEAGETPGKVLDSLGVKKYCCRAALLSNVDVLDEALKYHLVKERESLYS